MLVLAGDDHSAKPLDTWRTSRSIPSRPAACRCRIRAERAGTRSTTACTGWAMSRYSGLWVAMKCDHRRGGVVRFGGHSIRTGVQIVLPDDFRAAAGGLNIRWPDPPLDRSAAARLHGGPRAWPACGPTRSTASRSIRPHARSGIVTGGKAYLDTRQRAGRPGTRRCDVRPDRHPPVQGRLPWPLEAHGARAPPKACRKSWWSTRSARSMEYALKEEPTTWRDDVRPQGLRQVRREGQCGR
ncbi:hypothetical protein ACTMU2_35225 [Cupriavidus basilensis]